MSAIAPQRRCYLPLTTDQAQELHEHGALSGDLVAFLVTESVRSSDPEGDEEVWEWAALQDAAGYCRDHDLSVLVAAADVAQDTIDATSPQGSRVIVHGPVTLPRIASLHLGDDVVGDGSPVADDEVIELSWYDATELAEVRSLL